MDEEGKNAVFGTQKVPITQLGHYDYNYMEYQANSVFKTTSIFLLSALDPPAYIFKFLQNCSIVEFFG